MGANEVLQTVKDLQLCLDGLLDQANKAWVEDTPVVPMITTECYQNLMKYTGRMVAALGEVELVPKGK